MSRAMDCFDWHPMEMVPDPHEPVFVKRGDHVGQGKWSKGLLFVAPKIAVRCWPEAWAPVEIDLNA